MCDFVIHDLVFVTLDEDSSDEEQPVITPYEASGQSRLTNEFEILKSLGKGGFGDVIKVKETCYFFCSLSIQKCLSSVFSHQF